MTQSCWVAAWFATQGLPEGTPSSWCFRQSALQSVVDQLVDAGLVGGQELGEPNGHELVAGLDHQRLCLRDAGLLVDHVSEGLEEGRQRGNERRAARASTTSGTAAASLGVA